MEEFIFGSTLLFCWVFKASNVERGLFPTNCLSNLWYWLGGVDSSLDLFQVRMTDQYMLRVFPDYFTQILFNRCSSNVLKQVVISAQKRCSVRILCDHDSFLSFFGCTLLCPVNFRRRVLLLCLVQNLKPRLIEGNMLFKLLSCCKLQEPSLDMTSVGQKEWAYPNFALWAEQSTW